MESGQDPSHFWHLTLREIGVIIEGSVARLKRERDENIILAWHIEALARQKKMPKLEKMIGQAKSGGRRMTAEEIEAVTRSWLASRHKK